MTDSPRPLKKGAYIDTDADDSFLDRPEPRYGDDGHRMSRERVEQLADPAYRKAHGVTLPAWPARDPDA